MIKLLLKFCNSRFTGNHRTIFLESMATFRIVLPLKNLDKSGGKSTGRDRKIKRVLSLAASSIILKEKSIRPLDGNIAEGLFFRPIFWFSLYPMGYFSLKICGCTNIFLSLLPLG